MNQIKLRCAALIGFIVVLGLLGGCAGQAAVASNGEQPPALTAQVASENLSDHWAEPYARILIDRGILVPDADGRYNPNGEVTREDFLGWIFTAWGGEYENLITAATELEILDEEDLQDIDTALARNATAKLSVRSLRTLFDETADMGGNAYLAAQYLTDISSCHSCIGYVAECYSYGLMSGREPGIFGGEDMVTRAEAWVVVTRLIDPTLRRVPDYALEQDVPVLLTADAARRLVAANPRAIIVDVRDPEEQETGFVPGSICIPLEELKETNAAALADRLNEFVILYCQGGGRSAQAHVFLTELGFSSVFDMGGIDNWTFDLAYPQ